MWHATVRFPEPAVPRQKGRQVADQDRQAPVLGWVLVAVVPGDKKMKGPFRAALTGPFT